MKKRGLQLAMLVAMVGMTTGCEEIRGSIPAELSFLADIIVEAVCGIVPF